MVNKTGILCRQASADYICYFWHSDLMAQIIILPKKIMKLINSHCRIFLWTGKTCPSKRALVSWEKLCMPKVAGGKNILHICNWNKVVVAKQLWALATKADSMWIRWVHAYYIKDDIVEDCCSPRNGT